MSKKPFNREKAKSLLENVIIDSVQSFFQQENEKAHLKNQAKVKNLAEMQHIEEFVKLFESMRIKIRKFEIIHNNFLKTFKFPSIRKWITIPNSQVLKNKILRKLLIIFMLKKIYIVVKLFAMICFFLKKKNLANNI